MDGGWEGVLRHFASPDSRDLLHVTFAGKVDLLLRKGHNQELARPLPPPDGKYLALRTQTLDSNVWMIENF